MWLVTSPRYPPTSNIQDYHQHNSTRLVERPCIMVSRVSFNASLHFLTFSRRLKPQSRRENAVGQRARLLQTETRRVAKLRGHTGSLRSLIAQTTRSKTMKKRRGRESAEGLAKAPILQKQLRLHLRKPHAEERVGRPMRARRKK